MARPAQSLIVHPSGSPSGPVLSITPEQAGWEALHFEVRQLAPGARFESATGEHELGLMVLGGHGASLQGGLSVVSKLYLGAVVTASNTVSGETYRRDGIPKAFNRTLLP